MRFFLICEKGASFWDLRHYYTMQALNMSAPLSSSFSLIILSFVAFVSLDAVTGRGRPITFTPTSHDQLSEYVRLLAEKSAEMKVAEDDFKFDDAVDGIPGRGSSKDEDSLYAAIVFGENKTAVLDALYYYRKCIARNTTRGEHYLNGYMILVNTARKAFKVTDAEYHEVLTRAHFDHLIEHNADAQQLKTSGKQYLVETIARAYATRLKTDKDEVVRQVAEFARELPASAELIPAITKLIALFIDPHLQERVDTALKKGSDKVESERGDFVGKIFAIHAGFAEIVVAHSESLRPGMKLVAVTADGNVLLVVKEIFHTKAKATITGKPSKLKKGDSVFMSVQRQASDNQVLFEVLPGEENGQRYFATSKDTEIRFTSDLRRKLENHPRTTAYPLLIEGDLSDVENERKQTLGFDANKKYIAYRQGYNEHTYLVQSDFEFFPASSSVRTRFGHIGQFACDERKTSLQCRVCVDESCKTTGKIRQFSLSKNTLFYGHFFAKSGKEDTCEVPSYKEANSLQSLDHAEKTGEGGYIHWHIFSKDGKTVEAVLLLQQHYCL